MWVRQQSLPRLVAEPAELSPTPCSVAWALLNLGVYLEGGRDFCLWQLLSRSRSKVTAGLPCRHSLTGRQLLLSQARALLQQEAAARLHEIIYWLALKHLV